MLGSSFIKGGIVTRRNKNDLEKETPMKNLDVIKSTMDAHKSILKKRFKVKSMAIFGSYLRSEQNKDSDIDILVEFYETIDLFEFIGLENYLSEILNNKVDLVMKDTLKPRIKDRILREAVAL
jgi:predicted nucleotidyltransferase